MNPVNSFSIEKKSKHSMKMLLRLLCAVVFVIEEKIIIGKPCVPPYGKT